MSTPRVPAAVKLVVSFLFSGEKDFADLLSRVEGLYGSLDFLSEPLSFPFTDYYEAEMGKDLRRRVASFGPLISPEALPEIKLGMNGLETLYPNARGGRRFNIDPGYLAPAKFILATGKDYSHRIYLREGIYGDLTLIFRKGGFAPLPWTYPDYASQPLIGLLEGLRRRYLWQLKSER